MKIVKKIIGVLLIIVGILAALLGALGIAAVLHDAVLWGSDSSEMAQLIVFATICAIGVGVIRGGWILIRGRKRKAAEEQKMSGPQESRQDSREPGPQEDRQESREPGPQEERQESQEPGPQEDHQYSREPRQQENQQEWWAKDYEARFTLLVEDVFPIFTDGIVASGVIIGGPLAVHEEVWVLSEDGGQYRLQTAQIEAFQDEIVRKVYRTQNRERVGLLFQDPKAAAMKPGDVISNVRPNLEDVNIPIENPRLKGLIAGENYALLDRMKEWINQEMKQRTRFLVVVELDIQPEENGDGTAVFQKNSHMSFPYLTTREGENYQPVFTDWAELSKWRMEEKPQTMMMTYEDVRAITGHDERISGFVVNPFSDNYME
ncbi:SseB family protein [Hespellia stercorisuis]|uniref:SseB protein N-terminal domain-containing protein n=1 Tax=Hespellia stercorisuis DSM 15480 TaxID=1121950 RepID=A0A1M6U6D2_9FIRM|nr:SseB family protein [Hespellia stercorisuis]SHK64757.1 SseB protein N-terminal domain-containing protein [Hespellia stercorisuis DSM 15480]